MSDLAFLKRTRGHLRARVTKNITTVNTQISSLTQQETLTHISSLNDLKVRLEALDAQIASKLWSDDVDESVLDSEMEGCSNYNENILTALVILQQNVSNFNPSPDQGRNASGSGHIKYPTLPLPKFSHSDGESIEHFFQSF